MTQQTSFDSADLVLREIEAQAEDAFSANNRSGQGQVLATEVTKPTRGVFLK